MLKSLKFDQANTDRSVMSHTAMAIDSPCRRRDCNSRTSANSAELVTVSTKELPAAPTSVPPHLIVIESLLDQQ